MTSWDYSYLTDAEVDELLSEDGKKIIYILRSRLGWIRTPHPDSSSEAYNIIAKGRIKMK